MTDEYVIWSFEHRAWWKRAKWGYSDALADAGRYPKDEADAIVFKANRYAKTPHETAIPLADADAFTARGWIPIAPGAYEDRHGGLHIMLGEMLAFHGYADTPENREQILAAVREQMPGPITVLE